MTKQERPLEAEIESESSTISAARGVPVHNWRAHWLTASEFARMMGRDPQTVYKWLRNGTLAEFGVPVYQFRHGRLHSGRTFIQNIY
jgi:helix-turn-helix protein